MGKEFELKYQANPQVLQEIQKEFGDFSPIIMETTYLDTPDRALNERKWMLRLRRENDKVLCTVKTPLSGGRRGEWETEKASVQEALPELLSKGAPKELEQLLQDGVEAVCAARFIRLAKLIALGQTQVELALDSGAFLAGKRERPFWELEVELKKGEEEDAVAFAQNLAEGYHLAPEPKSKLQRALELKAGC